MKTTIKLEATDQMDATMKITMPIAAWKKLREQLALPGADLNIKWELGSRIGKLVEKAEENIELAVVEG